jgi:UPF0755 protein
MSRNDVGGSVGARRSGCLSTFGVLILLALGGWIALQHELGAVSPGSSSAIQITVHKGAHVDQIGAQLTSSGLVRSQELFLIATQISGKGSILKAGTYALSPSMSAQQIIDKLASGQTDSETVAVPEGFTASQIADRLAAKKLADRLAFLKVVATEGGSYVFSDGFNPPRNLEGYLYPVTYTVLRSSTPHDIAGTMLAAFDQNIVSKHPEVHDWRSTIILASMIEREALIDSDRPLIASVYYNRLRIDMPLQCDATVQYALPAHKTRLLFSDLRIDSPYNTYLHRGLPPGPICNPGAQSIEAALHPAQTDYLFYVAGSNGAHIFSRTLAEQDRQIALLRQKT